MLAVLLPGDAIDARSCRPTKALVRLRQQRHLQRAHQVGEPLPFLLLRSLSDPLHLRWRASPVLCPVRVSVGGFPLGRGPSLHRLDGRYPRLRRFRYWSCPTPGASCEVRPAGLLAAAHRPPSTTGPPPGPPRFPCMCERAELHDPASAAGPGPRCSDPCHGLPPGLKASASVPARMGCFGAPSPGPLTRPPTLRLVGRTTLRKGGLPGGELLPGQDLLDSSMLLLKLTCFLLPVSRRIQTSPPNPSSRPARSSSTALPRMPVQRRGGSERPKRCLLFFLPLFHAPAFSEGLAENHGPGQGEGAGGVRSAEEAWQRRLSLENRARVI